MAKINRILVTGAGGFVGSNLVRALARWCEVVGVTHSDADLRNYGQTAKAVEGFDAVIHCAGYKDVAGCEARPTLAVESNALTTGNVATACRVMGICFAYLSSNHLWALPPAPCTEVIYPYPGDWYGRSKWWGEQLAQAECPGCLIVRSSMIYGPGSPVLRWARKTLQSEGVLNAYASAYSTPTYVDDLADAFWNLLSKDRHSLWHYAGPERINRVMFFAAAQKRWGWPGKIVPVNDHGTLPRDCSLNSNKAYAVMPLRPHTLEEGLALMGDCP